MLDSKSAGRLLREDWKTPAELAREIYSAVTSRAAKLIGAPVEIKADRGQTALRLSRSYSPSRSSLLRPSQVDPDRPERPKASTPPSLGRVPLPSPTTLAAISRPARLLAESILGSPGVTPPARLTPPVASAPVVASSRPSVATRPPAPVDRGTDGRRVQLGPEIKSRSASGPVATPVNFTRPYAAPLFEVEGAVRAEPGQPVQFDSNPVILNKETGEYEPFKFEGTLTEVPRETPVEFWWGQVTSKGSTDNSSGGDGLQQYHCDLFRYPGAPAKWDNVVVRIYVLDPADTLPNTYPLFPIWLCPINGLYYAQPPLIY